MPLIIGAIAVAVITSLRDQSGISGRLSDSASAQTTSAYYVRDVQSATSVTTSPTTSSPAQCGTGTTFELGLTWGSGASGAIVSYWADPVSGDPTSMNLVRLYCNDTSTNPITSVPVAQGLSSTSALRVTLTPPAESLAAISNWTSTAGTSAIAIGALQSSSTFHFDLVAVPRIYTPQSEGVSGGGTPLPPPLLLLGSGTPALSCSGNGRVNISGTAYLNSSTDHSISSTGNAQIDASQIDTANTDPSEVISGGGTVSPSTPVYSPQVPDPYAGLHAPNSSGGPVVSGGPWSDGTYHGPGLYDATLSLTSSLQLGSGIYVLNVGISVTGNATITSAPGGVLLYVTANNGYVAGTNPHQSILVAGNGVMSIAPYSPGPYGPYSTPPNLAPNLGLWQASSDTNLVELAGNATGSLYSGTIYAPTAQVGGTGNASYTAGGVIASSFACSGNGVANIGG